MMIVILAAGGAMTVALVVAVMLLVRAHTALSRERASATAFRNRFPTALVDIDGEVARLRDERAVLGASIEMAKNDAEKARSDELAKFAETREALQREQTQKRNEWDAKFSEAIQELHRLEQEVGTLNEEAEMQSFGLYKPRYAFADADEYKVKLETIRDTQKQLLKNKAAAFCSTQWEVQGSAAEGRRMVERQMKLMLRAFNGDCEGAVASVSWKNIVPLRDRIRKSYEALNKLGETMHCQISAEFLHLKLDELELAYEYAEKIHREREEQRELREQMRDEEKAAKELERERDEAEREGERYQRALEKARAEVETAASAQRAALDAKILKLQGLIEKAEDRKQRAISQAELTRFGHVYVLSNEGSFGLNVFKIGMTRRLDPQDRVDELGSASVPFRFDVHAIIKSDDAPALEQKLHAALEPHRLNLVNHRKEYFRVPLEKIADLVAQHHGAISLTRTAEAVEYRKSLAIKAEREAMAAGKDVQIAAISRADAVKARYEELKRATA